MEALGGTGVQLFIDAGRPVDDALVQALLRDVLREKLASMVGSRAALEGREGGDGFPLPPSHSGAQKGATSVLLPVLIPGVGEAGEEEVGASRNKE